LKKQSAPRPDVNLAFEREVLTQADSTMMPDQARQLARRRTFAALGIFALAALVSPFVPLLGFGLICSALVLYVRPEAISGRVA
jgi:Sec-independent protein secretion pathway component TatC